MQAPGETAIPSEKKTFSEDTSNSRFKKKAYWDERFTEEEKYDWLLEFEHVADDLVPLISPSDRILVVGCGNSTFSRKLYDAGFTNVVNIDYSGVVIEKMAAAHGEECPSMSWVEMDMTKLTFEDQSFDVVIDKAAMDALVVDEVDVWDPAEEVVRVVHNMCSEVRRVLKKDNGKFILISFAQPHFRTKYLMGYRFSGADVSPYESHQGHSSVYDWDLSYRTINKGAGSLDSFMYLMLINPPLTDVQATL